MILGSLVWHNYRHIRGLNSEEKALLRPTLRDFKSRPVILGLFLGQILDSAKAVWAARGSRYKSRDCEGQWETSDFHGLYSRQESFCPAIALR
jgi:hypothetical protein